MVESMSRMPPECVSLSVERISDMDESGLGWLTMAWVTRRPIWASGVTNAFLGLLVEWRGFGPSLMVIGHRSRLLHPN
jgi:hypothetical protein